MIPRAPPHLILVLGGRSTLSLRAAKPSSLPSPELIAPKVFARTRRKQFSQETHSAARGWLLPSLALCLPSHEELLLGRKGGQIIRPFVTPRAGKD